MRSPAPAWVVGVAVCTALAVSAQAKQASKSNKTAPVPVPASVEPRPADLAAPAVAVDPAEPAGSLLARARATFDALEYERVIPLANAVLEREGITPDQKLDACLLQASSLAIIGDPIEAEKPFRMLLRGRPDYEMPAQTPPKIMMVFRKVQVEERAIQEQLRAIEVARAIASLKLIGQHPQRVDGGFPLRFAYRLQDPGAAVDAMRVLYRRQGESTFSTLALTRDAEGVWRGALPGEWTASDGGFVAAFYVATSGPLGELMRDGSASQPHVVPVAAGSVEGATPPPLPLWSFVTVGGVAGLLGLASLASGVAFNLVQSDYRTMASSSTLIDGRELRELGATGQALALTTNLLLASAGVAAVAAGVVALFTNWSDRSVEQAPAVAE